MKKIYQSILFTFLFTSSVWAQSLNTQKLDSFFTALESANRLMGSIAINQSGKIIYTRQIGLSNIEKKIKPNSSTKYRIGSITKTFTSVLVHQAIEENILSGEELLIQYFPTIQNADKITINNLLNHTSGIYNFTDDSNYLEWSSKPHSQDQIIQIINKIGSVFTPGTKAEYSNSNYYLLSLILEKKYLKNYSRLVQEKIIKKGGLKNTFVGSKIKIAANEAVSYYYKGDWESALETDMSVPLGAGSIVSTPSDITHFTQALFAGKLISSLSLEQMKKETFHFGKGLFVLSFPEAKGYGHTGGIDGFTSVFCYFPEQKTSFAFSANGINYPYNKISQILVKAIFDKPYEIPAFINLTISADTLKKYTGSYSSKELPIKILISLNKKVLMAQASGQPAFALEAIEYNKFKFEQAGAVFEFFNDSQMKLIQGGRAFLFKKE